MNTADQSISLVDAALRRRFRFIHFPPDYDLLYAERGFDGLDQARETLVDGGSSERMLLAASILALQELNSRIIDAPNLGKGKQVGHTNLMNLDGEEEIVDAWRFDILPLLEEYYFGQFNRLRHDLFDDGGERLIDWEAEVIERFGPDELFDALLQLAGFNEESAEFESGATDDGNAISSKQEWTEEMLFDQAHERLESDEAEALIDLYEFAGEVGQIRFGSGKKHGKALMYNDTVNTSIAVFNLVTRGEINFRWELLDDHENTKSLPSEAVRKCSEKLLSFEGAKGTMSSSYDTEVIDELPISIVTDSEPRERFKQIIREFIKDCQSPTAETETSG